MKLVTAAKMRELEKRADASGNSYAAMMEQAGTLTASSIVDHWPLEGRRVLVLVGPGNNGGDGLVCARALHDRGANVYLYLWKREPSEDDPNWRLCRERGIEYQQAEQDEGLARLKAEVARANVIVDAFLGTGVTRPIEGLLKEILTRIRAEIDGMGMREPALVSPSAPARLPALPRVAAVDLPSGLNPDTGELDPAALPATLTITFALPKAGQYAFPGAGAVGELVVADIGIRREWADDVALEVATGEEIRELLPARPRDSNKGTFGKALIACGSTDFTGAPRLAAAAAGRVGAGLVTLAVPRSIHPIVASNLEEATFLPLPDVDGAWSPDAVSPLLEHARDYSSLLVGCGFGRAPSTRQFVEQLFGGAMDSGSTDPGPGFVIDADALNALAEKPGLLTRARFSSPPILTPHPGEMARLIASRIADVQKDRVGIASRYAGAWKAVVVLKGAFTAIASPDGRVVLLPFADAALATAGTGDVLAGCIAGFLAQYRAVSEKAKRTDAEAGTTDAFRAALVGGYIHGLAGQLAGRQIGEAGVVAGDLVRRLPEAIRAVAGRID